MPVKASLAKVLQFDTCSNWLEIPTFY